MHDVIGECVALSLDREAAGAHQVLGRNWTGHAAWIAPYLLGCLIRHQADAKGGEVKDIRPADQHGLQSLENLSQQFGNDPGCTDAQIAVRFNLFVGALDCGDQELIRKYRPELDALLAKPGTGPCNHEKVLARMRTEVRNSINSALRR